MALVIGGEVCGQASSYGFSTTTGASLMSPVFSTIVVAGNDDAASTVQNIGFAFNYEGLTYTQFSVNSNGLIRLGATPVSNVYSNNISATGNEPMLMPLWEDFSTGSNGEVRFGLSGASPNRICVIDFRLYNSSSTSSAYNLSFQVRLYETTNIIEFVYGDGNGLSSASIGIGGLNCSNYMARNDLSNHTFANSGGSNNITLWPGNGRKYTFTPPSCSAPAAVTSSAVATTTATISWTAASPAPSGGYQYEVRTSGAAGSGAIGLVTSNTTAAGVISANNTGLSASTPYSVYVRSFCGGSDYSVWTAAYNFSTTQVPAGFPFAENFETWPNGWSVINGTQPNKWEVGTATAATGTKSAYVSNDVGATNTYDISSSSIVHIYRDIAFPTGTNPFNLQFKWKGAGESSYDYLKVYLVDASTITPVESVELTLGQVNAVEYSLQTTWQTENVILPNAGNAGNVRRLVFTWRNDGSVGTQPPVAIDDIEITVISCEMPTALTATNIGTTQADLGWTVNPSVTQWEIELVAAGGTPTGIPTKTGVTSNPYNYTGLSSNNAYDYYVRSYCGGSDYSTWLVHIHFQQLVH